MRSRRYNTKATPNTLVLPAMHDNARAHGSGRCNAAVAAVAAAVTHTLSAPQHNRTLTNARGVNVRMG